MLFVPEAVLIKTLERLSACGQGRSECVVYWTGPAGTQATADGWLHPAHRQSAFGYEVESTWLTRNLFQLAVEKRSIRAQLHTHPSAAFHSETDDRWPIVSQPGFLSIVVPGFGRGKSARTEEWWVGRLSGDGQWEELPFHLAVRVVE